MSKPQNPSVMATPPCICNILTVYQHDKLECKGCPINIFFSDSNVFDLLSISTYLDGPEKVRYKLSKLDRPAGYKWIGQTLQKFMSGSPDAAIDSFVDERKELTGELDEASKALMEKLGKDVDQVEDDAQGQTFLNADADRLVAPSLYDAGHLEGILKTPEHVSLGPDDYAFAALVGPSIVDAIELDIEKHVKPALDQMDNLLKTDSDHASKWELKMAWTTLDASLKQLLIENEKCKEAQERFDAAKVELDAAKKECITAHEKLDSALVNAIGLQKKAEVVMNGGDSWLVDE